MRKIFALLLLLTLIQAYASPALLNVGTEARKFLLLDTKGTRLGLKDFVGSQAKAPKPLTLLAFWSLSCVPCREEMPALIAYAQKYASEVSLVFINLDSKDQAAAVGERLKELGSTGLLDPYQVTGKNYNVCNAQGACNVPALYGIRADGTIAYAHSGFSGAADLEKDLNALRLQKAAPPAQVQKDALLREVHQQAPLDAIAKRHGLTRQALLSILQEAESAAERQWK